jgi:hypothetical protein
MKTTRIDCFEQRPAPVMGMKQAVCQMMSVGVNRLILLVFSVRRTRVFDIELSSSGVY